MENKKIEKYKIKKRKKMKSICLFEKFVVMGCPLLPIYLPKKRSFKVLYLRCNGFKKFKGIYVL